LQGLTFFGATFFGATFFAATFLHPPGGHLIAFFNAAERD
jgi:hypothetical protein